MLGFCLLSFHFLWAIHPICPVHVGWLQFKILPKNYTPEYSYACLSPFQITRPRSDVAKGHEGRSKGPATTKATKINTGNGGGTGSHSNFIIWTAEGRKKKGKDEQVLMAADDDDDDGCSRTIGEDAKHLNVTWPTWISSGKDWKDWLHVKGYADLRAACFPMRRGTCGASVDRAPAPRNCHMSKSGIFRNTVKWPWPRSDVIHIENGLYIIISGRSYRWSISHLLATLWGFEIKLVNMKHLGVGDICQIEYYGSLWANNMSDSPYGMKPGLYWP